MRLRSAIFRAILEVLSLKWASRYVSTLGWILALVVIALASGIFTFFTGRSLPLLPPGAFIPSIQYQGHVEFVIVLAYYLMGTVGAYLYFLAASGRVSERGSLYLVPLSLFLIVLAIAGLISGALVKR